MTAETNAKRTYASARASKVLTAVEADALVELVKERKAEVRRGSLVADAEGERDVLEKIAEMPHPDRVMAARLHALIKENAPNLRPKTWYGMPAYARDGKIVCFFKGAAKYNTRYASFGFDEDAHLDDGTMWPTAWALTKLTSDDEAKIAALVKKAAG